MHIGFYLDEWRDGGIAGFIARMRRELNKLGDTTTIFLARPFPKCDRVARDIYFRFKEKVGPACILLDLAAYPPKWRKAVLIERVSECGTECLLVNLFRPQAALLESLSHRVPVVGMAHTDHDYFYDEYLATQSFLSAQVCVSRQIYERCLRYAPTERKSTVRHIPNCVEIPGGFMAQPPGPLKVIYCSRFDRIQKRSLDLPDIWKGFLASGAKGTLSIIGSGQVENDLKRALADEESRGTVRFFGQLDEEAVLRETATGDVILNISNFEGLPQAPLEGCSLGLWPLLSQTASGHPEIVEKLGYGTLCPIGDKPAFTRALVQLASDLTGLRLIRPLLRAQTQKHFDLSVGAKAYHDLANEMAAQNKKTPPPLNLNRISLLSGNVLSVSSSRNGTRDIPAEQFLPHPEDGPDFERVSLSRLASRTQRPVSFSSFSG